MNLKRILGFAALGAIAATLVFLVTPAGAQEKPKGDDRYGIVSGSDRINVKLAEDKFSVRQLAKLKAGAICQLLPNDPVEFVAWDGDQVIIQRLIKPKVKLPSWKALKDAKLSTTCPWNGVVSAPREYWTAWQKAHAAAAAQKELRQGKKGSTAQHKPQ